MLTDEERNELREEVREQRNFLKENVYLYDKDGRAVIFSKTYLKKMNIMGWVYDQEERKYIRVKRVIHSKFWLAVHNLVAHPMLAIYRPLGEWLHEYTAKKMYEGPQRLREEDTEITAIMD
jgi:hypothetical protein